MTNHYGGPLKVSDKLYIMMWGRNEAAIKLISNLREVRKTQEKEKYKRYKFMKNPFSFTWKHFYWMRSAP